MDLGHGCSFNYITTTGGVARYRLELSRRVTGLGERIRFDALVNEDPQASTAIVVVREGETEGGLVTNGRVQLELTEVDSETIEVDGQSAQVPGGFTYKIDMNNLAAFVTSRAPRFCRELGLVSQ